MAAGEQSVEAGLEIVLAQAIVQNCQLAAPLSLAQRRSARPPRQPYVAADATPQHATPWELWRDEIDGEEQIYGLKTEVDTSSARFGGTPEYQAQLRGDRFFPGQSSLDLPSFLLEGVTFITEPSRQGFVFWVAMPRDVTIGSFVPINPESIFGQSGSLLDLVRDSWTVVWVGVEG
jgi:hypothetical protein